RSADRSPVDQPPSRSLSPWPVLLSPRETKRTTNQSWWPTSCSYYMCPYDLPSRYSGVMPRSDFVAETLAGWTRLRPDEDLTSLGIVQRLIWIGRLAEELLERTATASGLRRRGDYEVLADRKST